MCGAVSGYLQVIGGAAVEEVRKLHARGLAVVAAGLGVTAATAGATAAAAPGGAGSRPQLPQAGYSAAQADQNPATERRTEQVQMHGLAASQTSPGSCWLRLG